MKGFLWLAVIAISFCHNSALVRLNKEYEATIKEVGEKCRKEFKIDDDDYMELIKNEKIPESETGYCLITCFMKELGYYNDKKFHMPSMQASMRLKYSDEESIEKAQDILDKCMKQVDADENECTLNTKFVKCFIEMAKKEGINSESENAQNSTKTE